jgi:hypothetical protein
MVPRSLLIVSEINSEVKIGIQHASAEFLDLDRHHLVSFREMYRLLWALKSKWWRLNPPRGLDGWWQCVSGDHYPDGSGSGS